MFTRRKFIVKDLGIDVTAAEIEREARYLKSSRLQQDLRIAQIIPLLGGEFANVVRQARHERVTMLAFPPPFALSLSKGELFA